MIRRNEKTGAATGFLVGWGAKDFDAREAHEIFLEPNPNLTYRWGTYDFLGGVLRWDGALRWGWARTLSQGPTPVAASARRRISAVGEGCRDDNNSLKTNRLSSIFLASYLFFLCVI